MGGGGGGGGGRKIVSRSQNFGQINKTPLKVKVTRTGMMVQ